MNTKYMLLTLTSNTSVLQMGVGEVIKIISVEGFESPDYVVNTASSAISDGSVMVGKKVAERTLIITFGIDEGVDKDFYRRRVQSFFNPKNNFNIRYNYGYSCAQINGEVTSFGWETITSMWDTLVGTVEIKCPFPYWSDIDNFGQNLAEITPQLKFPLAFVTFNKLKKSKPKMAMGFKKLSDTVILENKGDVPTGLEIHFIAKRGAVSRPKLTNLTTGEFIEIYTEMAYGDVVIVNTTVGSKSITKNGSNIFKDKNRLSTMFQLVIGDNRVKYDATNNYINLDVKLYYTPKYLGV